MDPKKVITFGTFDILHPGHLYLFKEAKKYGDYLIVVLARDANVKKIKGSRPKMNERARLEVIKSVKTVNMAVLGDKIDWYKVIRKYKPQVICLGYDQTVPGGFSGWLSKQKRKIIVKRLAAYKPEKYKSSKF